MPGKGSFPISALGEAVGVRDRTVQDYLDLFKEFDWPVESSHAKGHRLSELAASARLTEKELFLSSSSWGPTAWAPRERAEIIAETLGTLEVGWE